MKKHVEVSVHYRYRETGQMLILWGSFLFIADKIQLYRGVLGTCI
jgi:hypothetical protein